MVLALAIFGHASGGRGHSGLATMLQDAPSVFNYAAYGTMLATIFLSEAVILWWRAKRDRRVRLAQIEHAFAEATPA
jgi:hypothetical protein